MEIKYAKLLRKGDRIYWRAKWEPKKQGEYTVDHVDCMKWRVRVVTDEFPWLLEGRYANLQFTGNAAEIRDRWLEKQEQLQGIRESEKKRKWQEENLMPRLNTAEGRERHNATLFDHEALKEEGLVAGFMGYSAHGYPWGTCVRCGAEGGMTAYQGKLFCRKCLCADDPDEPKHVLVSSNFEQSVDITRGLGRSRFHGMNSEWLAERAEWADDVIESIRAYELSPERKKKLKEELVAWATKQSASDLRSAKGGVMRQLVAELGVDKNRAGIKKRRRRHRRHEVNEVAEEKEEG